MHCGPMLCKGWLLSSVEKISPIPGVGAHRSDQLQALPLLHGVHEPTLTSPTSLLA